MRECEWGMLRERRRHRMWSRLQAVSTEPNVGLEPTNHEIMIPAEVRRSTNWATQAPWIKVFCCIDSVSLITCRHAGKAQFLGPCNWILAPRPWKIHINITLWFISYRLLKKYFHSGARGWLSWLSVWLRLRSWSHGSWVKAPHRALCWQLRAWSLLQILYLPLSLSLPCLCSVSLSLLQK